MNLIKPPAVNIEFKGIGDNDQIKYEKADICKAGRLGASYAISFYQIDYQALANSLSGSSSLKPENSKLIPVAKIVLDQEAFLRLRTEINTLHDLVFNSQPIK